LLGLKTKTIWGIGAVAVVLAAFVAALPLTAAYVLESMLRDRGATEVVIDDIDVNIFAGTVGFYGIVAHSDTGRLQADHLEIEGSFWSGLSRRVEIFDLRLSGGHLDLIEAPDGTWQFGALRFDNDATAVQVVESDVGTPWALGAHQVFVEDFVISLQSEQLLREFELHRLELERAFSWEPDEPLKLEMSLSSGGAELEVALQALPFNDLLEISGQLEISDLLVQDIRNPTLASLFEHLAGALSVETGFDLRLVAGETLDLQLDGKLQLLQAAFAQRGVRLEMDDVEWRGTASTHLDLSKAGGPADFAVAGEGGVSNLKLFDASDGFELLSLVDLRVHGLNATEQAMAMERLKLAGLTTHVQRLAGGVLRLPAFLATRRETASEPSPAPYSTRIGELILEGDNVIRVRDESVDPVFVAELSVTELLVKDLDTAGASPMSVSLGLSSSDTDQLLVAGTIVPFAIEPGADLRVDLTGFDVSRISAYVPGFNVERGRLVLASRAQLENGELDVSNTVAIDQLKIAAKEDDGDSSTAVGSAMPLDVTLDLLRDSQDRITLEIPITGTLANFEVGLNQVVRKAAQAALHKAAFGYVKTALQPFGAILFAANLAGKAARPSFESVQFAAGQASPTGEPGAYVVKLADLMHKRPGLRLTLCGVATAGDEIALQPSAENGTAPSPLLVSEEALLALAKSRADSVKDIMVSRGIDAQRVFDCRPAFEPGADGAPRVEVML